MKRVQLIVSGRVQGVWYRAYTQRKATELELCGYVRNLEDGTVEIVAEGGAESISALAAWAEKGSPMAKVREVRMEETERGEPFSEFSIRR